MPDSHPHLTPQQRAWARALERRVHPAAAPDAPQLDALFSDLSRALQREEESLRYADALGQLRRCAAAVILLVASISLSLWSSGSAEARLARRSEVPPAPAATAISEASVPSSASCSSRGLLGEVGSEGSCGLVISIIQVFLEGRSGKKGAGSNQTHGLGWRSGSSFKG